MAPTGQSRALRNVAEKSLNRAARRPFGAQSGFPLDPPKLAEQCTVRVAGREARRSAGGGRDYWQTAPEDRRGRRGAFLLFIH